MPRFPRPDALRPLVLGLAAAGGLLCADPAPAQGLALTQGAPFTLGFAPLPSFAWPQTAVGEPSRWTGGYASVSTGFEAVSSRRFGGYAGPTVGFEGGRVWQEGRFLYGVSGGFDYLSALGGGTPGYGRLSATRDAAGAFEVQVGALLTPDVLLYAKAGVVAAHGTLRAGLTALTPPLSRDDLIVRPDARVGVEWAVTDRLTLGVEAGVIGPGFR